MHLQRVLLSPAQLAAIPANERAFLVLSGHILNEVNALNKLLYCSSRLQTGPAWEVHSTNCQSFLFARTLVGKLNEAWTAIQSGYFKARLSETYDGVLNAYASEALRELKKYFGRNNLVKSIRNTFAFHYSLEHAEVTPPEDTDSEELALYLHHQIGNTLYQFAEFVMNKALLDSLKPDDPAEAMDCLLREMSQVVGWLNEFTQGAMIAILEMHVGFEALHKTAVPVELSGVPTVQEARIPYFVYEPEPVPTERNA
jgi:hypothetical protein